MVSQRNEGGRSRVTKGVQSFKEDMKLKDARLLDIVEEPWWGGPTVVMQTIFPGIIIQQQVNSLSTRHIQPRGVGAFDFIWTHFGFEDDDADMTKRRVRQANLFGPAGLVSADDGEVLEFAQTGMQHTRDFTTLCEMDGRDAASVEHNISETLIRGMYAYWRKVMQR